MRDLLLLDVGGVIAKSFSCHGYACWKQLFGVSRFNKEGFDITQSQTYEIQATAWNQLVHTTESPTGG